MPSLLPWLLLSDLHPRREEKWRATFPRITARHKGRDRMKDRKKGTIYHLFSPRRRKEKIMETKRKKEEEGPTFFSPSQSREKKAAPSTDRPTAVLVFRAAYVYILFPLPLFLPFLIAPGARRATRTHAHNVSPHKIAQFLCRSQNAVH